MSVRKITVNVSPYEREDNLTPVWCGIQYEDKATRISFYPDEDLLSAAGESALFRIDFNSADGYNPSENLSPDPDGGYSRAIPYSVTQNDGYSEAVFVVSCEDMQVLSFPVTMTFTPVERNRGSADTVCENISAMEKAVSQMLNKALAQSDEVKKLAEEITALDISAESLDTTKSEAENLIADVNERLANGEFKGEKGDAGKDGADGKDAVTDQTFDPESENAQSGIAVAEAVSGKADKEKWELINELTLTDDAIVIISADLNGDPFALKKFQLDFQTSAVADSTEKSQIWLHACKEGTSTYLPFAHTYTGVSKNKIGYGHFVGELFGHWYSLNEHSSESREGFNYAATFPFGVRSESRHNLPLTKLKLTYGYGGALPIGTTIKLWGVRT